MRIIDRKGENREKWRTKKEGGWWSSRRCGDGGNPLRAAWTAVRSQPVYCADIYRERRYQMLCEYNFSS